MGGRDFRPRAGRDGTMSSYSKDTSMAKYRALARLKELHVRDYEKLLDEEKEKLGIKSGFRKLETKAAALGFKLVPIDTDPRQATEK